MKYIGFVIAGLIFGAYSRDGWGVWVGGIIGFLIAWISSQGKRINELEQRLLDAESKQDPDQGATTRASTDADTSPGFLASWIGSLSRRIDELEIKLFGEARKDVYDYQQPAEEPADDVADEVADDAVTQAARQIHEPAVEQLEEVVETPEAAELVSESVVDEAAVAESTSDAVSADADELTEEPLMLSEEVSAEPTAFELAMSRGFEKIKDLVVGYFTGGNSLVRTGMLVLFVGVAFLLKYVAERTVVPVELRYIGVVGGALVMLVLGWRLRVKRPGFALSLQGGAVGLLYLTLFAAMRLHQLIPPSVVLMCLIGIVVLSAALAVLQNSMALAVIGVLGGFAAPILTSTGSGSHVQLFAYYLLLNLSIFGIAWFKSWRLLNVLGFVATFAVGSMWGYQYYQPGYFNSVEPFLIAHFLLYVVIAVLFAFKQPPKLKGINDGTLIFGTPIVVFALQAGLVRDMDYGLAYSALALGVFYVLLALLIKRLHRPFFKELIESFVALGVGFATLAIPLGFDGRVTSAMWVAEASALVWVGVRQSRSLPRLSGYALALLGCGAFFVEPPGTGDLLPFLNADYVGVLIVVAASLFMGLYTRQHQDTLWPGEGLWVSRLMLINAVLWWVTGSLVELHRHFPEQVYLLQQLWLMFTVLGLIALGHKVRDGLVVLYALLIQVLMLVGLGATQVDFNELSLFLNVGFGGLLVAALFSLVMSVFWLKYEWPEYSESINQRLLHRFFLAAGVVLWLVAMTVEIQLRLETHQLLWMMLLMALTAVALHVFGRRRQLADFVTAAVVVVVAMLIPLFNSLITGRWYVPPVAAADLPLVHVTFVSLLICFITQFSFARIWDQYISGDTGTDEVRLLVSRTLLLSSLGLWVINGVMEINRFIINPYWLPAVLACLALSMVLFVWLAHRLRWNDLHRVRYLMVPVLLLFAAWFPAEQHYHEGFGWLAWLLAFGVNYWILKVYEPDRMRYLPQWHAFSLWILSFVLMIEAARLIDSHWGFDNIWFYASFSAVLLLVSFVVFALRDRLRWPLVAQQAAYTQLALPVMMWVLWVLLMVLNLSEPGESLGLTYMPVLNIIDLVGLGAIGLAVMMHRRDAEVFFLKEMKHKYIIAAVTGFLMLNATMLRCFHYWYGIDYLLDELLASRMVQTGFSILWATAAVTLMVLAAKKHWRQVWLVGLGLMIVVVAKLFLVDMSASGSIERIVAFLTVGFLLSLVGYFSPLPPDQKKVTEEQEAVANA
ncbi:DUF2339 domain-containing protein [Marinicella sediminis]|uniref:DUF2339 domain-containing protein n=1 Tax=Marinicella sediminis TaxID=1792834 RepID=A0ABV7JB71_9GAMM|nr:DUF2339 domain-containing protein [Marinicella sediminis]